ncbi:(2Fe-2S)-binding protein [Fertoebacter nigrum]|uniref:(2Fe-2S)-binding protein n=1 Tax=Fertoeibacter niger TaxID=2656921 RepID=A0A8X8H414_9RHOB|nr:(2Fe-2S)-binding protein [Fertoeibacter niger]NUB45902.1 (2Fe-2S)-binding protein [Fertoeibacter niger]
MTGPATPALLRRAKADTVAFMVTVDGLPVQVHPGDSVAVAVLCAGGKPYRRAVLGDAPRAPYCMMGACFECLVQVDGVPNRQGCLVPARPGMRIVRQNGLNAGPQEGPAE